MMRSALVLLIFAFTTLQVEGGGAPDPGSVGRGGPFAPLRSLPPHDAQNASWGPRLAGALCAPPLCGSTQRIQNARSEPHSGPSPATEIRLIVKADDMAAGHGINVATIDAHTRGIVTTANVIVPGPWFPHAARLLNENPTLDAGVHLALTSEWENIKWRPLTHAASLVDADGYFFPMVRPRSGFPPGQSLAEGEWKIDEIERELRAQIAMAKRHIPHLTYTWNHMGFASLAPEIQDIVSRLSQEYSLIVPSTLGVQRLGPVYDGKDSGGVKAEKLAARLETIGPGLWLHVDHAATDDPEMRAFGHLGYEWVAADRSAVVEAWTSPKVREVIERRGIKLTNYRELAAR